MSKPFKSILAVGTLVFLLGCAGLVSKHQGTIGKQSIREDRAKAKIEQVDKDSANLNLERLTQIGQLSYGIDYALDKSTNQESLIAYDLNKRVETLAEKPSLDAVKEMQQIVSQMTSNNTSLLQKKDKQISSLQSDIQQLTKDKESAIQHYISVADKNAAKADQFEASLKDMDSFMGLGAVWYGLKHLISRLTWFLVGFGIIYTVLRVLAASYPPAGIAWSIFSQVGAVLIQMIEGIFPKAISSLKLVESSAHDEVVKELAKLKQDIVVAAVVPTDNSENKI
jgi:hypothetical protein